MKFDNYIFRQKDHKSDGPPQDNENKYYTILGDHDFIDTENKPRCNDNSKNVLAKQAAKKYYIKIGAHGKIFNPMGLFSEGKNQKFIAKIGKKEFDFKQVNARVFNLYLNFLSTKNIAWLNNAERELT
jgi:hypothetical protein